MNWSPHVGGILDKRRDDDEERNDDASRRVFRTFAAHCCDEAKRNLDQNIVDVASLLSIWVGRDVFTQDIRRVKVDVVIIQVQSETIKSKH